MKLTIDIRELVDLQKRLGEVPSELRDRAIAAALNKVASKGKSEVDRAIRDEFVISADRVRSSMMIRPASGTRHKLTAEILIFGSSRRLGRSLNVIHFLERKVSLAEAKRRARHGDLYGNGVGGKVLPILHFKFRRAGSTKKIDGAFIGNNGRTVFRRTGKSRLPIEPVQMIDVPQMFTTQRISRRVRDRIQSELSVEVDRAAKLVLSRLSR